MTKVIKKGDNKLMNTTLIGGAQRDVRMGLSRRGAKNQIIYS